MKVFKSILTGFYVVVLISLSIESTAQDQDYSYAYIEIKGKLFSKKLKVDVDLGDTKEQMIEGRKYSEILTNKKSFAAQLNYMVDQQFELVDALDYLQISQSGGGTSGIVFIMRRREL